MGMVSNRMWIPGELLFCVWLLPLSPYALSQWEGPIRDVFALSHADRGTVEVRIWVKETEADALRDAKLSITLEYPDATVRDTGPVPFALPTTGTFAAIEIPVDPVAPWSPDHPQLYRLRMTFAGPGGATIASVDQRFGVRTLETRDARFFVNGKPFYVRAYGGEGGCGCDDLSPGELRKRLTQARAFGFNAVRHHTHVPTDDYMNIADEVGLFVQMEIGPSGLGNDVKDDKFQASMERWRTIIRMARRHPSSFIYSVGNEIYLNEPGLVECLDTLHDAAKEMDPGTFFLNRSGSTPFNDAVGRYDLIERPIGEYEHVAEFAREAFELYLRGDRKGRSDTVPIIVHEYPLVASYPNPELAGKYEETPEWIKTTVEKARENGLEHLLPLYVKNTERIQALCRKEMLEEARKFPELDGYSMLRFVDCGMYVSGVVDDFADPKNVSREEFLRTNGETVILCTWKARTFEYGETLAADLEISHHGGDPFHAPLCRWWLMDGPRMLAQGEFKNIDVQPVDVAAIGTVSVEIPPLPSPAKLTLRAVFPDSKPLINNEWYFWAFPSDRAGSDIQKSVTLWDPRDRLSVYGNTYKGIERTTRTDWTPSDKVDALILTDSWRDSFYEYLDRGGRIWILSDKTWPWPEEVGIFGLHITRIIPERQSPPVFPELDEALTNWLTLCSNNPKRYGNSGTIVYPHPALREFPHEGFCDLQFWPMIYRAKSLRLADFPGGTEPLIRAIDNFHRGAGKGYMVELRVGRGRLFISTLNFTQSFPWSASSRFLFDRILRYTTGPEFNPTVKITPAQLKTMIDGFAAELAAKPRPPLNEMGARYETLWRARLQPGELVVLPISDARGVDPSRIGTHYEYAQTQFYFSARPGDSMTWDCKTKAAGKFTCALFLATPLKDVRLRLVVDGRDAETVVVPGGGAWNTFQQLNIAIPAIEAGEHTVVLSIPEDAPVEEGRTVLIRDVELRGDK